MPTLLVLPPAGSGGAGRAVGEAGRAVTQLPIQVLVHGQWGPKSHQLGAGQRGRHRETWADPR